MKTPRQLLAIPVMAFALSLGTAVWATDKPRIDVNEEPSLPVCKTHGENTQDCHIHTWGGYLHMKKQKPRADFKHAWKEYREFDRVAIQQRRK